MGAGRVRWSRPGLVNDDAADAVERAADELQPDPTRCSPAAEAAGNPVVPLVALLRDASSRPDDDAADVHRGLTSQDVLDTALMLVARDGLHPGARPTSR